MFLEAETSFGLNFLNSIPTNESLIFSPLSIALALSLVKTGAKGDSKSQIGSTVLHGADDVQFEQHFKFIADTLKKSENGVKAHIANRVYTKNGAVIEKSYLDNVARIYDASAESLDFSKKQSADQINEFVKKATDGKISDMVSADGIKDAVALLINAVYFKGEWKEEFTKDSTYDQEFFETAVKSKKIPFMHEHMSDQEYSSDDVFEVLILPYKDASFNFAIFLPKQKHGLAEGLKKLTATRFQNLLKNRKNTNLNTYIPKFKIEKELNLKTTLQTLGITTIFTDLADLSGIAESIKISDGVHKAMIEVDELGTVAAAASAVKAVPFMGRNDDPITFQADHPFAFALVKDNHPLFLGIFRG